MKKGRGEKELREKFAVPIFTLVYGRDIWPYGIGQCVSCGRVDRQFTKGPTCRKWLL
jgi:hypothetical protein